jgi:hypothetical protein
MKTAPNSADRFVDAIALLMVLGGVAMFAFARTALTGIGNGTRVAPPGTSAVALADFHVAQSKMGLWVVGVGVLVGVVAAVRHRLNQTKV